MKKYNLDEESVMALVNWAKTTTLPTQPVRLSPGENVVNVARFVEACLYEIRDHYPDPRYTPAITMLYRLKDKLEESANS